MFRFKRFDIEQDRTPMKVGTDGVLLGAWVGVDGTERRVLDIGTGTGLIALMLAQRVDRDGVVVDCVEIDSASAEEARENIERSTWAQQLRVHNVGIQAFNSTAKYDLIASNPPYFVSSLLSPNVGRSVARHTTELSFEDLIAAVERLLAPMGRFAVVLPVEESRLFDTLAEGKLQLMRRCEVCGRADRPPKRYLSEYTTLSRNCEVVAMEHLVIEAGGRGEYTAEYRELTADFYLKF